MCVYIDICIYKIIFYHIKIISFFIEVDSDEPLDYHVAPPLDTMKYVTIKFGTKFIPIMLNVRYKFYLNLFYST